MKYNPLEDPYLDYRENEIEQDVKIYLQMAREKRGNIYIYPKHIDKLLKLQAEDPKLAIRWIRYIFLGELNYKDVFINDVESDKDQEILFLKNKIISLEQQQAVIIDLLKELNSKKIA